MPATALPSPTERLAAIIAWLAACVAEQGNRKRLAGPLVVAIWTRLTRIAASFRAVASTPIPPPRPARPEPLADPATPQPASPPPAARPTRRPPAMPCGARWLVRLIPGTATGLSQLETLLRDPEMEALLAADPRLGHILRALCWMLGVRRGLMPPPRRRKPPAPVPPPEEPAPGQAATPDGAILLARRPLPPARFNLRARDLLFQLRMGPSSIWN